MLKRDSPDRVVEQIAALEDRADRCFEHLGIYAFPRGQATWATLVFLQGNGAQLRSTHNLGDHDAALINLGRRGGLIIKWIQERGNSQSCSLADYTWNRDLAAAVTEAWAVASNYLPFLLTFPMWHQNRMLADLQAPTSPRFTVPDGAPARRVSAFQKGIRPLSQEQATRGKLELTANQQDALRALESQCLYAGPLGMAYAPPLNFYKLMWPTYQEQLGALFRRADGVDLGPYSVGDLKRVYAGLLAVCATHEHLCSNVSLGAPYPLNSCVMLKSAAAWAALLAEVSEVDHNLAEAIVADLTLRSRRNDTPDPHIQPLVPVDYDALAVAPQFALNSRADENALRVCGRVRKAFYDAASSLKEQEMLDALVAVCPSALRINHNIKLPGGLPDIDLLVADESKGVVVIAELKWLRKPFTWKERIARSAEFTKGLRQVGALRRFLDATPTYLSKRGTLAQPLSQYAQVAYLLVARDDFRWTETTELLIVDFEVFKEFLRAAKSLADVIARLTTYNWLPEEGRDVVVRFDPATANGTTIETEVFYRSGGGISGV